MNQNPATPQTSSQGAAAHTDHQNTDIPYESNPFTITFKGLGLLVDFAKGVFVTMLVFGLLGAAANVVSSFTDSADNQRTNTTSTEPPFANSVADTNIDIGAVLAIAGAVVGVFVFIMAIVLVVSTAYKGFVAAGAVAASEKRHITMGEAVNAMVDRFSTLFKAELVSMLKIIGGSLLLIVPGVRAYLRYQALPYLIIADKNLTSSEAIKTSKALYNKHLLEVYGISTVGSIIPILGGALASSGMALSVQQLKAYAAGGKQTPKTHWLNYLGLIFMALFFVLIISLVLLLIILSSSDTN